MKTLKQKSFLLKEEYTGKDFPKLINEKIKNGWQPIGGSSLSNYYNDSSAKMQISQALVKFK